MPAPSAAGKHTKNDVKLATLVTYDLLSADSRLMH